MFVAKLILLCMCWLTLSLYIMPCSLSLIRSIRLILLFVICYICNFYVFARLYVYAKFHFSLLSHILFSFSFAHDCLLVFSSFFSCLFTFFFVLVYILIQDMFSFVLMFLPFAC